MTMFDQSLIPSGLNSSFYLSRSNTKMYSIRWLVSAALRWKLSRERKQNPSFVIVPTLYINSLCHLVPSSDSPLSKTNRFKTFLNTLCHLLSQPRGGKGSYLHNVSNVFILNECMHLAAAGTREVLD